MSYFFRLMRFSSYLTLCAVWRCYLLCHHQSRHYNNVDICSAAVCIFSYAISKLAAGHLLVMRDTLISYAAGAGEEKWLRSRMGRSRHRLYWGATTQNVDHQPLGGKTIPIRQTNKMHGCLCVDVQKSASCTSMLIIDILISPH